MIASVAIADLWPCPLADEAVRAFEIDWSDSIVADRTPSAGPERLHAFWTLKADAKAAWNRNDLKSFIGIGLILHRARNLNDVHRPRLGWALLSQRRFAEARDVLVGGAGDDHRHWLNLARALAGVGDIAGAREALRCSRARLAIAPPEPDLKQAADDQSRRPAELDLAADWPGARTEVRIQLKTGQNGLAAERLTRFFEHRLDLLQAALEAASATADRPPQTWAELRDGVVARLLLGLDEPAAHLLEQGASLAAPTGEKDACDALHLARAVAAAAPGERQAELLSTARALAATETGAARAFDLASNVLSDAAAWPALASLEPKPSEPLQALLATILARAGRIEAAVALFGELAEGRVRRQAARRELVHCVGLETTRRIALEPRPRAGPPRMFDLFPYNGELERLTIKLHEMAPWVDRFVIVESAETFSGRPKPIHFPGQSHQLAEFLPKITHLVVDQFPAHAASTWAREFHQRDEAVKALQGLCAPDDFVLLTDVDEVVDHRALEGFDGQFAVLKKDIFRYFLNYRMARPNWADRGNLILMRAKYLRLYSPSAARGLLSAPLLPNRIENAGWHFTSVGDAGAIAHKLDSYAHQENNRRDSLAHFSALLERLRAGETEPGCERCEIDILPTYVREHPERFAHVIL